jgi:TolB-like protein
VRFAVMDLDDNGVGADVARAITDQLSNRLALNPAVRLVERRRLSVIVNEQNLQKSGRTEAASAVQLARIFNVQKMLLGSVSKLGTTMVITVQLVDVETANLDGSREIQCRSCEVEELSDAMAELSHALVAEPTADMNAWPAPPSIEVDYPRDNAEVEGNTLTFQAHVGYSKPLDGVELLVNGKPVDASRLLDGARDGKLTKMSVGLQNVALVQEVPLDQPTNVIAIRALGGDGNDEQRILLVKRRMPGAAMPTVQVPAAVKPAAPAITYAEIEVALGSRVPPTRVGMLVKKFGVDFVLDGTIEAKLRALGATSELVQAIRTSKR